MYLLSLEQEGCCVTYLFDKFPDLSLLKGDEWFNNLNNQVKLEVPGLFEDLGIYERSTMHPNGVTIRVEKKPVLDRKD